MVFFVGLPLQDRKDIHTLKLHQRTRLLSLVLGALTLLLLSACGGDNASAIAPLGDIPELNGPTLHDTSVVSKASQAMKQLTSMHITTHMQMDIKSGDAQSSSPITSIIFDSQGDQQVAEKQSTMKATMSSVNKTINYNQITTDQQTYIQNDKGQWYVMSKQASEQSASTLGNGSRGTDYDSLLALMPKAKVIDLGQTTLNGTQVQHIALLLTEAASQDLLKASGQSIVQDTVLTHPTIELWLDPTSSYLYRIQTRFQMSSSVGGRPATTKYLTSSDYSNFNETVTIQLPTNPTSVTDAEKIFQ